MFNYAVVSRAFASIAYCMFYYYQSSQWLWRRLLKWCDQTHQSHDRVGHQTVQTQWIWITWVSVQLDSPRIHGVGVRRPDRLQCRSREARGSVRHGLIVSTCDMHGRRRTLKSSQTSNDDHVTSPYKSVPRWTCVRGISRRIEVLRNWNDPPCGRSVGGDITPVYRTSPPPESGRLLMMGLEGAASYVFTIREFGLVEMFLQGSPRKVPENGSEVHHI